MKQPPSDATDEGQEPTRFKENNTMSDIFHPCTPSASMAAARQTSDVPAVDPDMHRSMIRITCDADYQAKHFDPGHRRISLLHCLQAADACAQAEAVRA